MKNSRMAVGFLLAISLGFVSLIVPRRLAAADSGASIPAVIQSGYTAWLKVNDPGVAVNIWRKGGLLENDSKAVVLGNYFRRIGSTVGNYKSYELVEKKSIGQNSQIFYFTMHFERGAVYARFLVYQGDKGWVIQNMDFSTQPEAVMPWLAFQGVDYGG